MIYTLKLKCKNNNSNFKRDTNEICLEIGLGLIIPLKAEEAQNTLPKIKENIRLKITRLENDVVGIERIRQGFLKQFELYENMDDGMVNMGNV